MANKKKRLVNYERQKNRGFYSMHRGWLDHPAFGKEPLTMREIWLWLIEEATFASDSRIIAYNGSQYTLDRGQLAFAHSFMAEAWGCQKSYVGRALNRFKKFSMIETVSGTDKTLITICNYSKYQLPLDKMGTKHGMIKGLKQDALGTNYNKGNKEKKDKGKCKPLRADAHALPLLVDVLNPNALNKLKASLEPHIYKAWVAGLFYKDGYIICEDITVRERCKNEYSKEITTSLNKSNLSFEGFKVNPR